MLQMLGTSTYTLRKTSDFFLLTEIARRGTDVLCVVAADLLSRCNINTTG